MSNTSEQWYKIENIDQLDSPALVVYVDRAKANIQKVIKMVGDTTRLRPHVKTFKSVEVTQLMLAAGIQKFKCATIAEAEMLVKAGVQDILLAYQPTGPKLSRFIALIKAFPEVRFSCLTDNQAASAAIEAAAEAHNIRIAVYIDLNVGMNRTGIAPGEKALSLYKFCAHSKTLEVKGLHVYDGHFKDQDFNLRKERCDAAFEEVLRMKDAVISKGLPEPVIVAGGSPTFPIHTKRKGVECSPGTFIYWDKGYQTILPEQEFLPAALVISRVISLPDKDKICLDLGHKSIASENELSKRVLFLNAPELKFISQSEEHLVAAVSESHTYKVGDIFYGLPYHICPTCAVYEKVVTIENHKISGEWRTIARDRQLVF